MNSSVMLLTETAPPDPAAFALYLQGLGPWLIKMGGKLITVLLIFVIGRKVIAVLKKMLDRSLERADVDVGVLKFLKSLTGVALNVLLIFIMAAQIGVDSASIVALLGTAGLALSLALQGSLANFAGGILILVMKPFRVGDYIISSQGEGTVKMVGLVYTTLATADNKIITVPNGTLANSTITDVTAMESRRLDLTVGIGYSSDIKKAKEILDRLYRNHPAVQTEKDIVVYVDSLGDSAVTLGVRGWVASEDYWKAKWDLTEQIKYAFDEAGIEIPFNQMDVHILNQ